MMLMRRIAGRSISGFAEAKTWQLNLHKPHVQKYFENDFTKVEKEIKNIARKYSLEKKEVERIFRQQPEIFITGSEQRTAVEDKIKFLNKLEETQPLARPLNDLFFDSKHLLLYMDQNDILTFIQHLKDHNFTEAGASAILTNTNLIHNNIHLVLKQRMAIFEDYLHMTKPQILELFVRQPFFLTCSAEPLRESVLYFVERGELLSRKQLLYLLRNMGEVFLMGRQSISAMVRYMKDWGIDSKELWAILLKHPLLLLNHPGEIFHLKIKMLKQFRFTAPMGQDLLRHHPAALICSVRSLQAKFLTARDRLKITMSPENLQFLTFKFGANIRPRTEMLIRGKIPYSSQDITKFFSCSQNQFLQMTGIPQSKLQEEKNRFNITHEMDFPRRKCLRHYPSRQKILNFAKKYYPEEDLIVSKK